MKLHNGNLIVFRVRTPFPKLWSGPWFQFGNPGNFSGRANYRFLSSYIGHEAAKAVRAHFKCLRGLKVK